MAAFAAVMVPAVVAAGAIVLGMANGAIAASFSVSGSQFKVSADTLDGTGFVQYGGFAQEKGARTLPNGIPDPSPRRKPPYCTKPVPWRPSRPKP